ncbi:MAG TPA: hypothetical protein VK472_02390, partial [Allosphingosinicella sp.]|nr:hypothetical protein [Allosphingosinicella sp.]
MSQIARLIAFGLLLLASLAPAHAEWHRAASPHFEIYTESGAADARTRAERLERFDAVLRKVSGMDPAQESRPLTIFFVHDVKTIRHILGGNYGSAAGFYSPRAGGSLAVAPE